MLSFGEIYQSLEQYEKDNYYVKDSELEMQRTYGSGWSLLGAEKDHKITSEDFKNLAAGKDLEGNILSPTFEQRHRQGYDFTWSPHKSITLWAFLSKENLQKVTESMIKASENLVRFIEKEGLIQYRETEDGKTISKHSDNAVVLINTHLSGRLDPQVHNHLVIFNITKTPNDEWKAINSDALYANKYAMEAYLENQLAYELNKQGIKTELVKEGNSKEYVTKICGIEEKHWEGIARTSKIVDEYLQEHEQELKAKYPNASESQLREYAYLAIRESKHAKTVDDLFQQVKDALIKNGFSPEQIMDVVKQNSKTQIEQMGVSREQVEQAKNMALEQQKENQFLTQFGYTKESIKQMEEDQRKKK